MATLKKIMSDLGKKGGAATVQKHGIAHMKRISKMAAEARQKKK